ncbi:MAG: ABC transporter substrate-binding protein, partial [Oscillospiraceae bacterium]|nr:ABC transporter substrate-binding protein [Oscillospiraceae bacterium]
MKILKLLLILMMCTALLSGCWLPSLPVYTPPSTPAPIILEEPPEVEDLHPTPPPISGQFTLRYQPEFNMNPILALNRDNIVLTSFLYESLFILDEYLSAIPLLCENWHTEDSVTFTFEIMPDIAMHDGTTLTADDVAYSIRQARNHQRSRHRN